MALIQSYSQSLMSLSNSITERFQRLLDALVVWKHQHEILQVATFEKQILLIPRPPRRGSGNIERYYHFIFDLLIPLHSLLKKAPEDVNFVIKEFGLLTPYLEQVFPNRIKVIDRCDSTQNMSKMRLDGMNPKFVHLARRAILSFKKDIFDALEIKPKAASRTVVLLVERLPPDPYYLKAAVSEGGGASRRSITNHGELYDRLKKSLNSSYELLNIRLENLTLKEQIRCFSNATIVIAQHGAGLANVIWMKPGSRVIELNHNNNQLNHFRIISQIMDHRYCFFKTDGKHATIDIAIFYAWLTKNCNL